MIPTISGIKYISPKVHATLLAVANGNLNSGNPKSLHHSY